MKLTDEEQFARNLAQRREDARMSQSELARRMVEAGWDTYSQMTVSRTEKGERPIRLGEARALARILRSTLNDMIGATPDEATVAQARTIREDLDSAVVAVQRALVQWNEANETAVSFAEDLQAELPLSDPDADLDARSELHLIRVLTFDIQAIVEWTLSAPPEMPGLGDTSVKVGDIEGIRSVEASRGLGHGKR